MQVWMSLASASILHWTWEAPSRMRGYHSLPTRVGQVDLHSCWGLSL